MQKIYCAVQYRYMLHVYVYLLSIPMSWIWQVFHWQVFKKWHCRPLRPQNSNKQLCRMPASIHFTLSLLLAPSCSLPLARSLSLSLSPLTLKTTDLLVSARANLDTCTRMWHMGTIICTVYSIHKDMFNCLDILDISNLVSVAMLHRFAHFPAICWIFSMQLWHVKESPGTIRYWKM